MSAKRIDEVLAVIARVWKASPDLRLMQLLGNVLPAGDQYYLEDDKLVELMRNYGRRRRSMTPIGELVWTLYCEGKPSVFALPRNNAIGLAARVAKSVGVTVFLKTKIESMRVRPNGITIIDQQELA